MIEDEILALVAEHYQPGVSSVLMLSSVGAQLKKDAKWPVADDNRTLVEVAGNLAGITLIRDPDALAFVALVPKGQEQLAESAIANRKSRLFLRGLQRAVLFAFCLEVKDGQVVSLKLEPSPEYHVGAEIKSGYILVDANFRMPGLAFEHLDKLEVSKVAELEATIRAWCERHSVTPDLLLYRAKPIEHHFPTPLRKSGLSALDRLYEAQAPDVASRLIVPIDIALTLSRSR